MAPLDRALSLSQMDSAAAIAEDLDLDSIDVVDLLVKLQEVTNRKLTPSEFKSVRTVNDIVDRVHAILGT